MKQMTPKEIRETLLGPPLSKWPQRNRIERLQQEAREHNMTVASDFLHDPKYHEQASKGTSIMGTKFRTQKPKLTKEEYKEFKDSLYDGYEETNKMM